MPALVDLALGGEAALIVPEKEFRQICCDLQFSEQKLHELLRVVILAYASASRRHAPCENVDLKDVVQWITQNYIELRHNLPPDIKRLYLSHIAFPVQQ